MNKGIRFPEASIGLWLLMLLSGIIGVGDAHSLYYYSVPSLGMALCTILDLSRPFLAGIISFLVFRERLTLAQIAGGILLFSGAYPCHQNPIPHLVTVYVASITKWQAEPQFRIHRQGRVT